MQSPEFVQPLLVPLQVDEFSPAAAVGTKLVSIKASASSASTDRPVESTLSPEMFMPFMYTLLRVNAVINALAYSLIVRA